MQRQNYVDYFNKLLDYAKLCKVTVYSLDILTEDEHTEDLGVFMPSLRAINISNKMKPLETVAVLLHELGHFEDQSNGGIDHHTDSAYIKLNSGKKLTQLQKNRVLDCEKRAWDYGRGIAKKLKIPLGKWYSKHEKVGLDSYRSIKTKN